jgi:hypothetical protein
MSRVSDCCIDMTSPSVKHRFWPHLVMVQVHHWRMLSGYVVKIEDMIYVDRANSIYY